MRLLHCQEPVQPNRFLGLSTFFRNINDTQPLPNSSGSLLGGRFRLRKLASSAVLKWSQSMGPLGSNTAARTGSSSVGALIACCCSLLNRSLHNSSSVETNVWSEAEPLRVVDASVFCQQ